MDAGTGAACGGLAPAPRRWSARLLALPTRTLAAAWVVVLSLIFAAGTSAIRRLALLVGLVGLPAAAAILTYDGTRVFVSVSAAAFTFSVLWLARRSAAAAETAVTDGLARFTLAVMMLTPGLMTWVGGEVQAPWGSLLRRLGVELGMG